MVRVPILDEGDVLREAQVPPRLSQAALDGRYVGTVAPGLRDADDFKPFGALNVFLERAATGTADILVVGDSISEGTGATSMATTWPNRFLNSLRRKYQDPAVLGGVGYVPGYIAAQTVTPWANSGAADQAAYGLGLKAERLETGDTLTGTFTATALDILWHRYSTGGTFTVTVDGALAATIDTLGTPNESHQRTRVTAGLTGGDHEVVIAHSSGNFVIFEGAMVYDGDETEGLRMWVGARAGATAANYAETDSWADGLDDIDPALAVIELGVNDRNFEHTPAAFATDLTTVVSHVRTYAPGASILFVATYEPDTAHAYPWADYHAKVYEVAEADGGIAVYNAWKRLGSIDTADLAGWFYDQAHPSAAGHAMLGRDLAEFVSTLR